MYLYDFCCLEIGPVYCRFNDALGSVGRVAWQETNNTCIAVSSFEFQSLSAVGVHMGDKPGFYLSLTKKHPEYIAAVEALGHAVRQGPLDSKSLHLVQLAAAAAIRSEGAVHSHVRRALEEGVTPDEIRHALISLTSTIGFPNVTASLSWCEDVLKAAKPKSG